MSIRRKHPGNNTCFVKKKKNNYLLISRQLVFICILLAISFSVYADITTGAQLQYNLDKAKAFDQDMSSLKNIARIIIYAALTIGVLPVVRSLATGKENGKKLVVGWFVGLIVGQIALILF